MSGRWETVTTVLWILASFALLAAGAWYGLATEVAP